MAAIPESHRYILETANFAYLSTFNKDGSINTNPVSFDWDGENVRVSTLKGRIKYQNLAADPRVTICIVDPRIITQYLELRGRATLQDDPDGVLVRDIFRRQTGGMEFEGDEPGDERATIIIDADRVLVPNLYGGRYDDNHALPEDQQ